MNGIKKGIIWHTQGSGKSIVMVLLAKWILENNPNARVVVITDRDELDKQIEGVFTEAGEDIRRTRSGHELMKYLGQAKTANADVVYAAQVDLAGAKAITPG